MAPAKRKGNSAALRQGVAHFNGGRFEEALRCFRAAAASGDGGPEPRVFLGHVANSLGRRPEAIAAFASVIDSDPRHLPAYAGLANILLHQSPVRDRAAEKTLLGILALKPGGAAFRARLMDALRACGQALRASGDLENAEKALARALALGAPDGDSQSRLVDVLRMRGQSYLSAGNLEKAEKELRKILALDPDHAETREGLIRLLRQRGLGGVAAGRLAEAERALRRALALAPRDPESRRQLLGVLLMRSRGLPPDRPDLEQKALRRALAFEPSDREARRRLLDSLHRRARARLAAGELEAAELILRRALAFEPGDREVRARLVEALRLRARAHRAAGRAGRAEKLLRRALLLSPGDAELRRDVALILRTRALAFDVPNTRRRFRAARRAWEAVLKMDPRDGAACVSLSLLTRWIGRPDQERAALRRAVAKGRELAPADRFKALMRLGRHAQAVRVAEKILDQGITLLDFRAFSDPWEKDNRPDREAPLADLAALDRGLRTAPGPWRQFYLGCLGGPEGLRHFDAVPAGARYRWMHYNAAMEALFSGSFRRAVRWFNLALRHEPMDWRAHGYLSEAYVCIDRPAQARREMARSLAAAPENERAQVHAWWGELELWLGAYERALERSTRACAMGAPFAHGWKGAALLKLGRRKEALAQLDFALRLYPNDVEARLWRAEAQRELGRHREALAALDGLEAVDSLNPTWMLFNRALVKRALGDEPGMKADFERLPAGVVDHVRRRIGLRGSSPLGAEQMSRVLEAGLKLARGFRRGEYEQAVWLSRRSSGEAGRHG